MLFSAVSAMWPTGLSPPPPKNFEFFRGRFVERKNLGFFPFSNPSNQIFVGTIVTVLIN